MLPEDVAVIVSEDVTVVQLFPCHPSLQVHVPLVFEQLSELAVLHPQSVAHPTPYFHDGQTSIHK
ncbi:hypothetical protein DPMN_006882 [Dreissena polymorpha]|uniref:Uncharacterized protein n=1 Tax=Dreissena polymorpha TaxID=45954 RepID=A0A9D4MT89_DREPO|nr:hypothetical protein DPMN_006882 [Dreissena polymorpha]